MLSLCDNCSNLDKDNNLIQYFIDVIEEKDAYTQGHSHHVRAITEAIYNCLPNSYQSNIDKTKLLLAALLHDIGKIKTPDTILNKDAPLSDDEWEIMKQHPKDGAEIIKNTLFSDVGDWILYHHETIDGKGYYGLKGDEIPLEARIIAIADTFSALRTYRIYRPAKSIEETIAIMRDVSGQQLDEEILSFFLSLDKDALKNLYCNCKICVERRAAFKKTREQEKIKRS
ncbi:MAG: HD domain-containing protein [Treponema sp.]|jgi:putative nucleotidyltransferase with HDIG domain|nr:HD domain-containing protein [Treponema sp.]